MKPEVGTRWRRILVNKTVGWIGGGIVDKTVAAIAAPLVLNPIQTTTSAPPSGNFVGSSGGGFSLPKTGGQTTTPFPAAAPNSSLWGKIKSFFDW
ncbi:MAG: hypothetical protein HY736_19315 [Verrucomicrobia bacterium]|nr:hypothetical protein [Verrucomicrobiota bacterium]